MTITEPPTAAATSGPPPEDLPRMSLGDHIDELRSRLIKSFIALAVALLVVLPFKDAITGIYVGPYEKVWYDTYDTFLADLDARTAASKAAGLELDKLEVGVVEFNQDYRAAIRAGTYPSKHYEFIRSKGGFGLPRTLKALGGIEDMWVYMSATLLFALALAAPIVIYQIWAFIAAGLYRKERRTVMGSLPWAFVLFGGGVAFGYFVAVPFGLFMLVQFMNTSYVEPNFSVQQYFGLLLVMTGALGVIFQLPLVMVVVHRAGLVSHAALKQYWRHIIVGMFIVSAILTPPDVVTQLLMAMPMSVLYLIGLLLTGRAERRRVRRAEAAA